MDKAYFPVLRHCLKHFAWTLPAGFELLFGDEWMVRVDMAAKISVSVALHYNGIAGCAFQLSVCALSRGKEQTGQDLSVWLVVAGRWRCHVMVW